MDTKEKLKELRKDLDRAVAAVAANTGVTLNVTHCSYTQAGGFTFKVEGALAGGKPIDAVIESERQQLRYAVDCVRRARRELWKLNKLQRSMRVRVKHDY